MEIIGTDKIGFVTIAKHGQTSLRALSISLHQFRDGYDFINVTETDPKEIREDGSIFMHSSSKILLFPWRDEFESVKSGFLQDMVELQRQFGDSFRARKNQLSGTEMDKDTIDKMLLHMAKYLFNKKNNIDILHITTGHKKILYQFEFFQWFLTDYDKFYFFDLKYLSNPKLIEWISEHDSRWKNVSIPQKSQKSKMRDKVEQLKNMLSQIKDELGDDYLDYDNIQDWTTFIYYYEFSKMFFESRKKSEQFLNFD